jgi:hypothetical protein
MRRNGVNSENNSRLVPFVHEGVVDLDECLYPTGTNIVLPIEAKLQHFQDLSWHKLAFPCYRFISQPRITNGQKSCEGPDFADMRRDRSWRAVAAVYCAYDAKLRCAIIHAFPAVKVHSGKVHALSVEKVNGLILNEKSQMIPAQSFRVDMAWI